jgi:alpha-tubulin suppressor-like RCC1 family protein
MSKKYYSICQYKIHFWFLARIKKMRMKKMRLNVIKIQRLVRAFIRRKFRTSSKLDKVDYSSWNLNNYITEQEKKVKPTIPYGKFDFSTYVTGMIKSAVNKSDQSSVSEFIREDQYEEIKKKNVGDFNPKNYIGSLIKKVSNKLEFERKLESEHKAELSSNDKNLLKQDEQTSKSTNTDKNISEAKKTNKLNEKKDETLIKQDKKPQPKNEIATKFGYQDKVNNKALKETKKPHPKVQENEKRKMDNLNIIREEIKAEDSEKREPSSEDKILKIQGKWKSKRASRWIDVMREKVFIIQRNFRKLLIKKYDLPDNYFYNEVFLRKQLEIFEKNVMENMKVLFPAIFESEQDKSDTIEYPDEENKRDFSKSKINKQKFNRNEEINLKTQSKLLTDRSFVNSNLRNEINKTSLVHNPYEDGKIHLFSNILDIDFMVETDEIYEKLWASSYQKIFTHCLNSNAPLQLMSLGTSHTVCLSNKGKAYSFGWNNFGQCGVPVKSTIISKKELEEETEEDKKKKAEFTVSKNLKVINKIEGMKIPQIEELLIAKSVACGEDHTLLLDHEGEIWCFGINLNGQLGLGHKNLVEKPSKLTALSKLKITTIKTEGEVNFAVSGFGDAYMWPWNDKNKLRYDPLKISLKNEKVSTVSCGNNFVLLLCQSGKIYSMGKTNNYGQLGLGDTHPRYRPTLIEFFVINQERVTQISCGYKHAGCKTSTGRVYTWGLVRFY